VTVLDAGPVSADQGCWATAAALVMIERPAAGVMVIDALLTDEDQSNLVAVLEGAELSAQELGRSSRSRTRRRGDGRSPKVPQLLWARLEPILPPPTEWFPPDRRPRLEPDIAHWRWSGCNVFTRFYDYGLADEFRPHFDESWRAAPDRRSLLTVLVYLPTGERCEGGETVVEGHAIAPHPGRVAVFDHRLIHAGQPVLAGRKLVLRNDVIASATIGRAPSAARR